MWFGLITLFPDMFQALNAGITGRALKHSLIELQSFNPRDYAYDKHKTVDHHPYGGGPGMVMMAEPIRLAITAARAAAPSPPTVIYLSPQGRQFKQEHIPGFLAKRAIIFLSGRYEGIDQRIIDQEIDEEWSIGDYILTGGELAAMNMIDAITRFIPGALGDANSALEDTLSAGLLKYPQYTRPEKLGDLSVPDVLLSGNHAEINRWRRKQSLGQTWQKRPDLLAAKDLNPEEKALLSEFIEEFSKNV